MDWMGWDTLGRTGRMQWPSCSRHSSQYSKSPLFVDSGRIQCRVSHWWSLCLLRFSQSLGPTAVTEQERAPGSHHSWCLKHNWMSVYMLRGEYCNLHWNFNNTINLLPTACVQVFHTQGRSQAWAWGSLNPQNEKLAPQIKFSPCYIMGYY